MEAKIVVGTKSGKSYNLELKDNLAAVFIGKKLGDTVNLTPLGLKGYEVQITGGSDKCGFPMRRDVHLPGRASVLLATKTPGYRQKRRGVRVRKTVVGDTITEDIAQINVVVVKEGKDSIEKLLGLDKKEEAGAEGETEKKGEGEQKGEEKKSGEEIAEKGERKDKEEKKEDRKESGDKKEETTNPTPASEGSETP